MKLFFYTIALLLLPVAAFDYWHEDPVYVDTLTLTNADIKAFPTAEGHGKNATGGRGRGTFIVSNLNNSGTGSFRQACIDASAAGGGTITFSVAGNITITSEIEITGSNITIAGETAPGDGITIYGRQVSIVGQNFIVRHIRFRPGDPSAVSDDCLRILKHTSGYYGSYSNYMIDHCSFSWSKDENIAVETGTSGSVSVSNITIQNCISSEGFGAKGWMVWGQNITNYSAIGNYLAHNSSRNPRSSISQNNKYEWVNNWVYHYSAGAGPSVQNWVDYVNNVWEDGPDTQSLETIRVEPCSSSNCPPSGITDPTGTQIYSSGNTWNGSAVTIGGAGFSIAPYIVGTASVASDYVPLSNASVKASVTANAGARVGISGRDLIDSDMITDGTNGTGSYASTEAGTSRGGLVTLAAGTAYTDTDSDGLSDAYETANGGSISPTTRPATFTLTDTRVIDQSGVTNYATTGYTYMDVFLAEMAGDWDNFTFTPGGGGGPATGRIKAYQIKNGKITVGGKRVN